MRNEEYEKYEQEVNKLIDEFQKNEKSSDTYINSVNNTISKLNKSQLILLYFTLSLQEKNTISVKNESLKKKIQALSKEINEIKEINLGEEIINAHYLMLDLCNEPDSTQEQLQLNEQLTYYQNLNKNNRDAYSSFQSWLPNPDNVCTGNVCYNSDKFSRPVSKIKNSRDVSHSPKENENGDAASAPIATGNNNSMDLGDDCGECCFPMAMAGLFVCIAVAGVIAAAVTTAEIYKAAEDASGGHKKRATSTVAGASILGGAAGYVAFGLLACAAAGPIGWALGISAVAIAACVGAFAGKHLYDAQSDQYTITESDKAT